MLKNTGFKCIHETGFRFYYKCKLVADIVLETSLGLSAQRKPSAEYTVYIKSKAETGNRKGLNELQQW